MGAGPSFAEAAVESRDHHRHDLVQLVAAAAFDDEGHEGRCCSCRLRLGVGRAGVGRGEGPASEALRAGARASAAEGRASIGLAETAGRDQRRRARSRHQRRVDRGGGRGRRKARHRGHRRTAVAAIELLDEQFAVPAGQRDGDRTRRPAGRRRSGQGSTGPGPAHPSRSPSPCAAAIPTRRPVKLPGPQPTRMASARRPSSSRSSSGISFSAWPRDMTSSARASSVPSALEQGGGAGGRGGVESEQHGVAIGPRKRGKSKAWRFSAHARCAELPRLCCRQGRSSTDPVVRALRARDALRPLAPADSAPPMVTCDLAAADHRPQPLGASAAFLGGWCNNRTGLGG